MIETDKLVTRVLLSDGQWYDVEPGSFRVIDVSAVWYRFVSRFLSYSGPMDAVQSIERDDADSGVTVTEVAPKSDLLDTMRGLLDAIALAEYDWEQRFPAGPKRRWELRHPAIDQAKRLVGEGKRRYDGPVMDRVQDTKAAVEEERKCVVEYLRNVPRMAPGLRAEQVADDIENGEHWRWRWKNPR